MTDAKTQIAAFMDRVLTNEAWAESGDEVATEVMRILTEAGWRAPSTQDETEYGVRMTNGDVAGVGARHNAIGFLAGYGPEGELVQRSKPGPWVSVSSVEGDK